MKGETLQLLITIGNKINRKTNKNNSFAEILEYAKAEIHLIAAKFNLKKEEALFLAGSCIYSIEYSPIFDVDALASSFGCYNMEILLYQKHLKSLVEQEFWVEFTKESYDCSTSKSSIEVLNKEFSLHTFIAEQLA